MSVAVMKKLTLFVCASDSGEIISKLTKKKCVEISRSPAELDDAYRLTPCAFPGERSELERNIARIEAAIEPLTVYSKRKFSLVKPKLDADREKFMADGSYESAWVTVERIEKINGETVEARAREQAEYEKMTALEPWESCEIPLDFAGTDRTALLRGAFPPSVNLEAVNGALGTAYALAEKVGEDARGVYATVVVLKGFEDETDKTLTAFGFVRSEHETEHTTARLACREAERQSKESHRRINELNLEIRKLADELPKLRILCDIERTRLTELRSHELLACLGSVEMLTGWVPEDKTAEISEILDGYGCAYEFGEPDETDDTPVLLKNNKFAENFEWVVELYSLPKYGAFDPTMIMAVFYILLFGMMFADVGYGLVLILGGFLIPKILNPSPWANKFFRSFGWCGVACVGMGVLFGGYFGDFPIQFARNMLGRTMPDSLAIVADPVLDSLKFMIIGIAFGAIHLITGMIIKFIHVWKEESPLHAILDVGMWWVLFAGIALLFIAPPVGKWVLIAGAAGIFVGGFIEEKKWIMKPVKGLLRFYDIINFASDLLSYSRILALGLTSAVIAQVVNVLGTMAGPTAAGIVIMVIAFIFGHALNIGLNTMGTFVHAARLQYVEFFGKFYVDGGKPFEPVKPVGEYTKI